MSAPRELLPRGATVELIQDVVADYFRITPAKLLARSNALSVVRPRQIAMALARELTPDGVVAIGQAFGGRDHTTVKNACAAVARMTERHPDFADILEQLRGLIRAAGAADRPLTARRGLSAVEKVEQVLEELVAQRKMIEEQIRLIKEARERMRTVPRNGAATPHLRIVGGAAQAAPAGGGR